MIFCRLIVLALIISLAPVAGYAQLYRYIDENGVERFSNEPPPPGAKILDQAAETPYDTAADAALQERTREAAAAVSSGPTPPTPPKAPAPPTPPKAPAPPTPAGSSVGAPDGAAKSGAVKNEGYSRRKHRRKKQIRKENAEIRKALEASEKKP